MIALNVGVQYQKIFVFEVKKKNFKVFNESIFRQKLISKLEWIF